MWNNNKILLLEFPLNQIRYILFFVYFEMRRKNEKYFFKNPHIFKIGETIKNESCKVKRKAYILFWQTGFINNKLFVTTY